jgi:hypothetical protein
MLPQAESAPNAGDRVTRVIYRSYTVLECSIRSGTLLFMVHFFALRVKNEPQLR